MMNKMLLNCAAWVNLSILMGIVKGGFYDCQAKIKKGQQKGAAGSHLNY